MEYTIIVNKLNVRKNPAGEWVGFMRRGERVTVTGESFEGEYHEWLKLESGNWAALKRHDSPGAYMVEVGLRFIFTHHPCEKTRYITQGWGKRPAYYRKFYHDDRGHQGIDFGTPVGEEILAVADGVIYATVSADEKDGENYGNHVKINHAEKYRTYYSHLSGFTPGLMVGHEVKAGQVIGYAGNTGNSSGPHLHFSLWLKGRFVDPTKYIRYAK